MASKVQAPFLNSTCRHCDTGKMVEMPDGNEWWLECDECGADLFCYVPMIHQNVFHMDEHKFRMWAGGFGSAKTSTCAAEMTMLTLSTPNGTSLIGAQTYPQLEQTAKKDFMAMVPKKYIASYSVQKNELNLTNGHRILFRTLDDEGKIRSLNLCYFWIEEASEVKYDLFAQLQTRLRSAATEKHKGIMSTNPDLGWIREEFLLKSELIIGADRQYEQIPEEIDSNFSTHIAKTKANIYLPADYYDSVAKGKPEWWVKRFLEGSFDYTEGAVYPMLSNHIVEPFEIPRHWERIAGADFGLRDHTVLLMGAIDPKTGTVYIYDEYFENGKAVSQHAEAMHELLDPVPPGLLRPPVGDPAGKRKQIADNRSIFDHYAEYGIYFKPGINAIEAGIMKVYSYFVLDRLKIFRTCKNTIREGVNYKYPDVKLTSDKNPDEKPIDKDNHTMDTLKYMMAELPDDPSKLINKSVNYHDIQFQEKKDDSYLPHALKDDVGYVSGDEDWYNYY